MTIKAVAFDFGQTLGELDAAFLATRLAEKDVYVSPDAVESAVPEGWAAYDAAVQAGVSGHPWKVMMREVLSGSGVTPSKLDGLVDWLWEEQPKQNLWRRPIADMVDLVIELHGLDVPLAIISNSEGKLRQLAELMSLDQYFAVIADSGALGMEKPGPEIFRWTASELGVEPAEMVHIGDSYGADVKGALGAGLRAIWYHPPSRQVAGKAAPVDDLRDGRLATAATASATRGHLKRWGLSGPAES